MSNKQIPPQDNSPRPKRFGCGKGCLLIGGGLFVVFLVLGGIAIYQTEAAFARADKLWFEGNKDEAVSIYTSELEFASTADLPEIYKRIITHRHDSGDTAGAAEYCTKAIDDDVDVRFSRDDLRRVFADARRATEARKAVLNKKWVDDQTVNPSVISITWNGNDIVMIKDFKDGRKERYELATVEVDGQIRYYLKGSDADRYCYIDSNGNLTWVNNGKVWLVTMNEANREAYLEKKKAAEAKYKAEEVARQQAEEQEVIDAVRREVAEKYHGSDGLYLLRDSVSGQLDRFGGTISGTVINRRPDTLAYVQITFNLYDNTGAQVGSAMANINGLEPGGRWKFKATSFGVKFSTFKFSSLTGF